MHCRLASCFMLHVQSSVPADAVTRLTARAAGSHLMPRLLHGDSTAFSSWAMHSHSQVATQCVELNLPRERDALSPTRSRRSSLPSSGAQKE